MYVTKSAGATCVRDANKVMAATTLQNCDAEYQTVSKRKSLCGGRRA